MSFGTRLTKVRKSKGLTQGDLGKGLGTDGKDATKAVVYGWEKDQHFPRVDQLKLICERLGCSADYLLFGTVATSSLSPEVAEMASKVDRLEPEARNYILRFVQGFFELQARPATLSEPSADQPQTNRKQA